MAQAEMTMRKLRPFWGRVTVVESPVDEMQRDSGLIVPVDSEGQEHDFMRGVVIDVDQGWHDNGSYSEFVSQIEKGTVVYFRGGVRIGDVFVVEVGDILAFEVDD